MTATDEPKLPLSRRRRIVFALVTCGLVLVTSLVALLIVDIYLHRKYERTAGLNIWGYRGRVQGRKAGDEYRIVVLGGSTAYGYGLKADEAIPAVLERNLSGRMVGPFKRFTVINLGYNNEGAYSFKFTLDDYLYLRYDLAILYEGYNDLMGAPQPPNTSVFRHDSPIFRLTGYMPIFPIVFKEKAAAMVTGSPATSYLNTPKTTFRPGLATKAAAEVLRGAAEVSASLEQQLGRVAAEPPRRIDDPAATGCRFPWQEYCRSTMDAVDFALANGVRVIVAAQPHGVGHYYRGRHAEQQAELAGMLQRRYGASQRVRYLDLSEAVDLSDSALSFDRMHLTAAGNDRLAPSFVQPVIEMAAARAAEPR
jgi:hypothetical protein